MPRNDLSDSFSVRHDDDPRRPLKAMQQEVELEHGSAQADDTGGVEHQSRDDREGVVRERRHAEATSGDLRRSAREQDDADDVEATREDDASGEGKPGPQPKR